ncbi:glycine cleavage system protein GcvH [Alienimonas californiensis]|uniref:Glycine cleavage system H protein n=1 Tax=Alienimonas californiensis TaxID=2527989 RepID=A0A517PDD2_9PLAN|nr:glycine cleavage system protein GcvH [Alienimonas californiensis]QDT17383.1 Glycine cleavage system H protein [Alienimonas californiensis]
MSPDELHFLESHEWVGRDGDLAVVGISDFAVNQLTDLVYVDLPPVGSTVTRGETFGEVESVKAVSDLYSPVTGEVVEVNGGLEENMATLSEDPFGDGWLIKVRPTDEGTEGLMDAAAYREFCTTADQ